jgi:toxin ParE1/3/4
MEIRVLWSATSLRQLKDIFDYYSLKASVTVADKLVKKIVEKSIQLETNPLAGPKEPLLEKKQYEYRYLVAGNYKLIYRFSYPIIRIVAVYDCRQNPTKLEEIADN